MEDEQYDEERVFVGYIERTVDPGNTLLITIIVLSVTLNLLLPCIVSYRRRGQEKKENKKAVEEALKELKLPSGIVTTIFDTRAKTIPRSRRIRKHKRVRGIRKGENTDLIDDADYDTDGPAMNVEIETQINENGETTIYTRELIRRAGVMRIASHKVRHDTNDSTSSRNETPEPPEKDEEATIRSRDETSEPPEKDEEATIGSADEGEAADVVYITIPPEDTKRPGELRKLLDKAVSLVEWDRETKRLFQLTVPFACQALAAGLFEILNVAVIGKKMGTREVSAYVIVNIFVELTSGLAGGFHEALTTLCSHAIGRNDTKLTGQYVQISTILYTMSATGFYFFWREYMYLAVEWMGFDEETTIMAHEYAMVLLIHEIIYGFAEVVHTLLDLVDRENHSMIMGIGEEAVSFVSLLTLTFTTSPSLQLVAIVDLIICCVFLVFSVIHIYHKRWLEDYGAGMFRGFAFCNLRAVVQVFQTALPLSAGYLLMYGEWEILTIFASFLGPAEVATWGILGSLWGAIEDLTEAIGDAAEIRCAFLLGSSQPEVAKRSAYKAVLIGFIVSTSLSSILFIAGDDLPRLITNDATLQKQILELIPLFGIGNVALTVGTICWTLLGAQGRYRLATLVAFAGSWLVTLPLSAVFTIGMNYDLQGQTSAIVIGNLIAGTLNSYTLFRSDWEALSKAIVEYNESSSSSDSSESSSDENSTTDSEKSTLSGNGKETHVIFEKLNGIDRKMSDITSLTEFRKLELDANAGKQGAETSIEDPGDVNRSEHNSNPNEALADGSSEHKSNQNENLAAGSPNSSLDPTDTPADKDESFYVSDFEFLTCLFSSDSIFQSQEPSFPTELDLVQQVPGEEMHLDLNKRREVDKNQPSSDESPQRDNSDFSTPGVKHDTEGESGENFNDDVENDIQNLVGQLFREPRKMEGPMLPFRSPPELDQVKLVDVHLDEIISEDKSPSDEI